MRDCLAVSTLSKEFNVPESRIRNCVMSGRLSEIQGKINVSEFGRMYREDANKTPLLEVIVRLKMDGWVLTSKNVGELTDAIEKNRNWGASYTRAESLLVAAKKTGIFVDDVEKEVELLTLWLQKHTDILPHENYSKLWQLIDEDTKNKLTEAIGVQENAENAWAQPQLHRVMSGIIQSGKSVSEWGIPDIHLFGLKFKDERSQTLLRKIIMKQGSSDAKKYYKQARMLKFRHNNYSDKRYSVNQFLSLGVLLFTIAHLVGEGILVRALSDSMVAQAILFMAMHLVCGWRRADILSIRLPMEVDITDIIDALKEGSLPLALADKIWLGFRFTYEKFGHASKNGGELTFAASIEMGQIMGVYLTICEYHRILEKRESLFEKNAPFDKLCIYQEALGFRAYTEIFGNEIFRSRAMNKAFLTIYDQITSKKFKNMHYKSLPEILTAYLRGHKIDLKKGQKTIFHYIDFTSEGLSIDEISMALFQIGTLGFYKRKVIEEILPEISEMNLKQTAEVISAAEIDVEETEELLGRFIDILDGVASMESMPTNVKQLVGNKVINAIVRGTSEGKEDNVFCLYQALHGRNNPECRTQVYCTDCGGNSAYGNLCKFAIYSYEYVFNIILRLATYESRLQKFEEAVKWQEKRGNVNGAKELAELYSLELRRLEQTEETFEQFISDDKFPELLRDDLIELYLERTNQNVPGTV